MSELLVLSFDVDASPSITLQSLVPEVEGPANRGALPYGWGFGWYSGDQRAGIVIKDPTSEGENAMSRVLRDWENFRSTIFVCHIRGTTQQMPQRDTQPFIRTYGGRQWMFAHTGDLTGDFRTELPLGGDAAFEPIGRTDSEHVFSWLLRTAQAAGARRLAEVGWTALHQLFIRANWFGSANFVVTDGQDLAVYQDRERRTPLQFARFTPREAIRSWQSPEVLIHVEAAADVSRTVTMVSTLAMSEGTWQPMGGGQLIVLRRGAIIWNSSADDAPAPAQGAAEASGRAPVAGLQAQASPAAAPAVGARPAPTITGLALDRRRLRVFHRTVYRYETTVERSAHVLRVSPLNDSRQRVLGNELNLSVPGLQRHFEDVFGNQATSFEPSVPYSELVIESRAVVDLRGPMPGDLRSPHRRDQIPLVWMPWQRQMMLPYLLPVELPETELLELSEFAMSFVERNDYDLLETLLDLNTTIYKDFAYVTGSTTVETTPFDVYTQRRGVCQDFANLLVCLARLLNIPARYRSGYIYTGGDYENKVQSEASHAWTELYLPWIGWRGFDPTNGCLAGFDHVRVACGRNYRDATPTSGTLYKGGGTETLVVEVKVELDGVDGSGNARGDTPPRDSR